MGATPSHPFWSVSRQSFIPAGELVLGEEVVALDGQTFRLTSITPRAGPEAVFNLEVANEHTYYVSRDGLLVHNSCATLQNIISSGGRLTAKFGKVFYHIPRAIANSAVHAFSRHSFGTLFKDVSRFNSSITSASKLKGLVTEAMKKGKILRSNVSVNSRGEETLKVFIDVGKNVGLTKTGLPTQILRVVIDPNGVIKTVHPW